MTYNVPNTTTPSQIQSIKPTLDPVTGANSTTSPLNLYLGVLPGLTNPSTTTTAITNLAAPNVYNYQTKLPTMGATGQIAPTSPTSTSSSGYYWVCLRRPANLFAPVSLTNPMIVVDAVRFPYLDGTGPLTTAGPAGGPPNIPTLASAYRALFDPALPAVPRRARGAGSLADRHDVHRHGDDERSGRPAVRVHGADRDSGAELTGHEYARDLLRQHERRNHHQLLRDATDLPHARLGQRVRAGVAQ